MERFFELVLLADQSLVQAGWVATAQVPSREAATQLLAAGPQGRADLPLPGMSLKWSFEPRLGVTTVFHEGRMMLLSILLGVPASANQPATLDLWMDGLRSAPPIAKVSDAEAFEIIRRMRERPLCASVLLPEGSREDCKALLDFHRGVAASLFTARWS